MNARVLDDSYVILGTQPRHRRRHAGRPRRPGRQARRRAHACAASRARSTRSRVKRARRQDHAGRSLRHDVLDLEPGPQGQLFGGAIIRSRTSASCASARSRSASSWSSSDGEDQIAIHPVMYMALCYDHRIVDGVAANAFLWTRRRDPREGRLQSYTRPLRAACAAAGRRRGARRTASVSPCSDAPSMHAERGVRRARRR